MFLMSCIRLDIAYSVSELSSYMSNPRAKHWQEIMRLLKYLRFTHEYTKYLVVVEGKVTQTGYQMLKTQNPIVVMYLY